MKHPIRKRNQLTYREILESRMWYRIDYRDTEYGYDMYAKLCNKRNRLLYNYKRSK